MFGFIRNPGIKEAIRRQVQSINAGIKNRYSDPAGVVQDSFMMGYMFGITRNIINLEKGKDDEKLAIKLFMQVYRESFPGYHIDFHTDVKFFNHYSGKKDFSDGFEVAAVPFFLTIGVDGEEIVFRNTYKKYVKSVQNINQMENQEVSTLLDVTGSKNIEQLYLWNFNEEHLWGKLDERHQALGR